MQNLGPLQLVHPRFPTPMFYLSSDWFLVISLSHLIGSYDCFGSKTIRVEIHYLNWIRIYKIISTLFSTSQLKFLQPDSSIENADLSL